MLSTYALMLNNNPTKVAMIRFLSSVLQWLDYIFTNTEKLLPSQINLHDSEYKSLLDKYLPVFIDIFTSFLAGRFEEACRVQSFFILCWLF